MSLSAYRCAYCLSVFNETDRKPCIGKCDHSICLSCDRKYPSEENSKNCPICLLPRSFNKTEVNYQGMEMLKTIRELASTGDFSDNKSSQLPGTGICSQCKDDTKKLRICVHCCTENGLLAETGFGSWRMLKHYECLIAKAICGDCALNNHQPRHIKMITELRGFPTSHELGVGLYFTQMKFRKESLCDESSAMYNSKWSTVIFHLKKKLNEYSELRNFTHVGIGLYSDQEKLHDAHRVHEEKMLKYRAWTVRFYDPIVRELLAGLKEHVDGLETEKVTIEMEKLSDALEKCASEDKEDTGNIEEEIESNYERIEKTIADVPAESKSKYPVLLRSELNNLTKEVKTTSDAFAERHFENLLENFHRESKDAVIRNEAEIENSKNDQEKLNKFRKYQNELKALYETMFQVREEMKQLDDEHLKLLQRHALARVTFYQLFPTYFLDLEEEVGEEGKDNLEIMRSLFEQLTRLEKDLAEQNEKMCILKKVSQLSLSC